MLKTKYFPTFVTGFAAAVLTTIPGLKNIACCLLLPVAVFAAIYINTRINGFQKQISFSEGLIFGILTGIFSALWATFFDLSITFFTKSHEMIRHLPEIELSLEQLNLGKITKDTIDLIRNLGKEITLYGFSPLFSLFILINNLISDMIFGIIGGLISVPMINKKFFTKEQ